MKPKDIRIKMGYTDWVGNCVMAARNIKVGEFIAEGLPEFLFHKKECQIPWKEIKQYNKVTKRMVDAFCIGTKYGFIPPDDFDFNKLSIEWYFSHSCDGNMGFDKNGDFIAISNIKENDMIAYDYALVETNPKFRMKHCRCFRANCRGVITGNDWKGLPDEEIRYAHPYVQGLRLQLNRLYKEGGK